MTTEPNGADLSAVDDDLLLDGLDNEGDTQDQDLGDDAPAEDDEEAPAEQPKPRKSAQERIDEVTRARREAEREADYWRGVAEGRIKPDGQPQRQEQRQEQRQSQDAPPNPEDFQYGETDPAFIAAFVDYRVKQGVQTFVEQQQQRSHAQTVHQTWQQKQSEFAAAHPDFFDLTQSDDLPITPPMAEAIKTGENGPAVAYYLAQHPDEARRIAGIRDPIAQIRAIDRLEGRLTAQGSTPKPKTVSDAPSPAPQARGLSGRFTTAPDTDDLDAFEKRFFGG